MSIVASMLGQDFAYAHGRIGVLQQLLMRQSDVDRLLGSHGRKEAEGVLTELKLTSEIDQGISDWNSILTAIEEWVDKEVMQMSPVARRPVFQILWMDQQAPLLAYLLKKYHGHTSEISQEPSVGRGSVYSKEELIDCIENGTTSILPDHLIAFIDSVKSKEEPAVYDIDTDVQQYVASRQLSLARASGSAHIKRYVQHRIDIQNIRTALRHSSQQKGGTSVESHLLNGGTFTLSSKHNSAAAIAAAVETTTLPVSLAIALRSADDHNGLERAFTELLAEDIAHMWNVPLSIEPLFAFAAIALNNLRLARSILIGKCNDLSPQEIKSIAPPFIPATHYVLS